jgi:hypothetical protein
MNPVGQPEDIKVMITPKNKGGAEVPRVFLVD